MRVFVPIVIVSCLFFSCDSQPSGQSDSGHTTQGGSPGSHGTGIWEKDTYTDELGQTREREYISNRDFIAGSFGKTAAPQSPLNVRFRVFGQNSISLQLFENAGSDPVRALSPRSYTVSIENADGGGHTFKAINYSDRLAFEKTDAVAVHDILMKGGRIRFTITDDFKPGTQYQFTIDDAGGYDEAYRSLAGN